MKANSDALKIINQFNPNGLHHLHARQTHLKVSSNLKFPKKKNRNHLSLSM